MLEAVEEFGEVDAEVIDLRWLDRASIDWDTIGASIRKTNHVLIAEQGALGTSYGGWLADEIQRRFFDWLDPPVQRVTGGEASPSISKVLERAAIARTEEVVAAAAEIAEVLTWPGCCGCRRSRPTRTRGGARRLAGRRRTRVRSRRRHRHRRDRQGRRRRRGGGRRRHPQDPGDPGPEVEVGAPIAVLGDPGEVVADLAALLADLGVAEPVDPVVAVRREVPDTALVPDPEGGTAVTGRLARTPGARVFASPLARRLAKEAGLPVDEIDGTGPRNRILRRDVELPGHRRLCGAGRGGDVGGHDS